MRKNHPPRGRGIVVRAFCYTIVFIAMIGMREILTDGDGPVNQTLGRLYNRTLMASSKLCLGLALMSKDEPGKRTMIGDGSRMLGRASVKAYVSASKRDLYGH